MIPNHEKRRGTDAGEQQHHLRASLDVPRTDSKWLISDSASKSPQNARNSPRKAPAPPPHRPMSMTSLPNLQSPPTLTVNVPSSPPKSQFAPKIERRTFVPSAARFLQNHSLQWASEPQTSPKTTLDHGAIDGVSSPSNGRPRKEQYTPSTVREGDAHGVRQRTGPPPINRADKPRIMLKPAANEETTSLRPSSPFTDDKAFVEDKASPFSTPPSSDEDSQSNMTRQRLDNKRDTTFKQLSEIHGSASTSIPPGAANDKQAPVRVADARAYGFSQMRPPAPRESESKPALPRRRLDDNETPPPAAGQPNFKSVSSSLPSSTHATPISIVPPSALMPPRKISMNSGAHHLQPPQQPNAQVSNDRTAPQLPSVHAPAEREMQTNNAQNPDPAVAEFPDISKINRSLPYCPAGARGIELGYEARLIDICDRHVCTAGHVARVWDVVTGDLLLSIGQLEREIKVTAVGFKPSKKSNEEGTRLWLGTNYGDLQEIDIFSESIVYSKTGPHERHEIAKIHRHQNAMWTIDVYGKLCVWSADDSGLPNLQSNYTPHRVQRGHSFSLIIEGCLWLASGKEIRIYRPGAADGTAFEVLQTPLCQSHVGPITSGAVIASQPNQVYFGHADGKVSVYSTNDYTCLGIIATNVYKINSLVGAGSFLWAAFSIGTISVYDTTTRPWTTKKSWLAHQGNPVQSLAIDRSSLWKSGISRLASIGSDNTVRFWDGCLEQDWLGNAIDLTMYYFNLTFRQEMRCALTT